MAIVHISDETNAKEVLEAKGGVIVDFFATWCGPCKMLSPVLEQLAEKAAGQFKICKVDIDQCPQTAQAQSIMVVPTLIFYKDGQIVSRSEGYMDEEEILEVAAEHF